MTGIRLPPMNCRGFFVTMKKIEIETSKGKFLVIDNNNDWFCGLKFNYFGDDKFDFFPKDEDSDNYFSFVKIYKLSDITEEQASEVVDLFDILPYHYQDYERQACAYNTAIESLHSLLKSKGIHLFENPVLKPIITKDVILCNYDWELEQWQEAEQKTFYNPYIFKL